ncbi:MAG: A24 family peptidase [Candidatus Aenigmatarchaeota archaeon]
MFGLLLLAVGVCGFGLAAYWDVKTTEFPDWLPYSIIVSALAVRGVFAFILSDPLIIINSVAYGVVFLVVGLIMYLARQWGDGDAWLMGALGFLFPDAAGFSPAWGTPLPFWMTMILNFFMVSLFYLVLYAVALGVRRPGVWKTFRKNVRARALLMAASFAIVLAASLYTAFYLSFNFGVPVYDFPGILAMPFLAFVMLLFLQYAKAVESDLFRRKVRAKDLRVGDVLITGKWRGITAEEVEKYRKKGGDVWIKEGVRFAPVFLITVLVTIFLGSVAHVLFPLA